MSQIYKSVRSRLLDLTELKSSDLTEVVEEEEEEEKEEEKFTLWMY